MKNLLPAIGLVALTLAAVLFFTSRQSKPEPEAPAPIDLDREVRKTVLRGETDGVEVLVYRRAVGEADPDWSDRSVARAAGLAGGPWALHEVLILNKGDETWEFPDPLVGEEASTSSTLAEKVLRLRDAPARSEAPFMRELLLQLWSPDSTTVDGHSFRREFLVIPTSFMIEDLEGITLCGARMSLGTVDRQTLETWLETETPNPAVLEAALGDKKESQGQ